jgi:hypothetical protein
MGIATPMARRWITAAALAGTLGFGGVQALAAPRESEQQGTCNPGQCMATCRQTGWDGGRCFSGDCLCYRQIS